jgi:hypothetical protein
MHFLRRGVFSTSPNPKLEDHPSSAVRGCLFNLFTVTLHIGGRSSIRNLRTRHAVVTGTLIHGRTARRGSKGVALLKLCTGRTAHRVSRGIALLFLDHGTRSGWGVSVTPRPLFNSGKNPIPLCTRLGGPQDRSGQMRRISPPPEFDPRMVQPLASRYTDWAPRPTILL